MTVLVVLTSLGGFKEHLALLVLALQNTGRRGNRDGFGGYGGFGHDGYPPLKLNPPFSVIPIKGMCVVRVCVWGVDLSVFFLVHFLPPTEWRHGLVAHGTASFQIPNNIVERPKKSSKPQQEGFSPNFRH